MIVDANVVFIFIFLVLKLVLCSEIGGIQCESLIDNPLLLGRCVNESLSLLAPISTNQQSKVCMITRVTPEIYSYAGYGLFIQAVFAHAKRYRMLPVYPDSSTPDYAYYRKLVPILEAFDRHSDCDYILWMDADAIPLSFDFDPLTLLPNSDVEVMLSSDVSTMVNTGCFLVKRTPWTRQFLRRWLSCGGFDNELYSPRGDIAQNDQLGFDCAYSQLSHEKRSKISILPSHALNTVLPAFTTLNHDHLILHLAAEDNAFRVQVLRKAADGIIRCIRGEGCQPQWGLSREVLLNIATNHYENMFRTLKYDRLLLAPNSLSDNVIAQWLAELRMSTGKLAHIIQHHNQTEDELLVRLDGFESAKSVGLNLFQCAIPSFSSKCASSGPWPGCSAEDALQLLSRHSLQHDNSCRRTLPEACKTVAELGFELAVEFSKRTMASISNPGLSQILMDVDGALALLQGLVDHKQQSLVNGMVVEFHSFLSTAHYISITNF